jgi:hypothetical protein
MDERVKRSSAAISLTCTRCESIRLWRDGLRHSAFGDEIQRWLCRDCSLRFSDPQDVQKAWSSIERIEGIQRQSLKSGNDIMSNSQICVTETKNLAAEQKQIEVPRRNIEETKGKIVEHAFWMQKEGYAEATISRRIRLLKTLANKGANLQDPESIKETIAKQQKWSTKTKEIAVETYSCFLKMRGKTWKPPRYKAASSYPPKRR